MAARVVLVCALLFAAVTLSAAKPKKDAAKRPASPSVAQVQEDVIASAREKFLERDKDGSGFLETAEVQLMLDEVEEGKKKSVTVASMIGAWSVVARRGVPPASHFPAC